MSQLFNAGIIVSRGNSTSTPLAANATFTGTIDDVTSYEEIDINIAGGPAYSPGSLYFEFSPDGINWDVSILVGGAQLTTPNMVPQHLRVVLPYFRVRYINGNILQTSFRLTVVYHRVSGTRLTRYLNQTIDNTEGVQVTRSIIDGYRSDGTYGNILASTLNHLIVDGYIQNFPVTQPVSGTITAIQGTSPWIVDGGIGDGYLQSILANQTNGAQQTIIDGYVQTNPNVNVVSFPNDVHVIVDGYVDTNPNVNIINIPTVNQGTNPWTTDVTDRSGRLLGHVSVDGYVQTNPNVNVAGIIPALIDANNSSTTPLGGNASFTGTGIDVSNYGVIAVFAFADQAGTLNIEFSTDNSHWDNIIPYNIPASDSEHVQIGPQARYFRAVYTNGSVAQSTFRLQTIYKPITSFPPTIPISSAVDANGDAFLVKSVLTGRTSTTTVSDTNYTDVLVNPSGNLSVYLGDSSNVSAFSALRTVAPLALFANKQIFNSQPLYYDDQQTAGGGTSSTFLTNKAATQMTVTQNVAGTRTRQSFRRMNYQPGKSQLVFLTGVLVNEGGSGNTAVNRRLGLFDGYNGFFFELTGITMNVAMRTNATGSPITTYIAQNNWNLDKLDGTGVSGITFDVSKAQIFVIDFQWLGTGRIRYGFDINGVIHYCHQILIANLQSVVSISNPNLPIRFEIQSLGSGSSSTSSMQHICATVISEGGQEDVGFTFGIDMGATSITTGNNTNTYALLAMQLQSTMVSANIVPTFFTIASATANAQFKVVLVLNPTIAGAALSYNPVSNSAMQFATAASTNTITNGTVIYSGYFQSNKTGSATDQFTVDVGIGANIAGVSDTLVLAVQPTPAAALNFLASFNWKEQL